MGWADQIVTIPVAESGMPEIKAIIQNAVPEKLLQVGQTYLTGENFGTKTLTYKGQAYTPGALKLVKVNGDGLVLTDVAEGYRFTVATRNYKVVTAATAVGKRLSLLSGGEPILWRLVRAIVGVDPTEEFKVAGREGKMRLLAPDECVLTTSNAATPITCFYMNDGIMESFVLQDGTMFRQQETLGGAITWWKFRMAGGLGITERVESPVMVSIASVKNIDLTDLGNLQQISAGLDTVDGTAWPVIGTVAGKGRIEQIILLTAQTDTRQNGPYLFSCYEENINGVSVASRLSPFLPNSRIRIGRDYCLVERGDRWGQTEAYPNSATPVGTTVKQIIVGTTPHFWDEAKPDLETEEIVTENRTRIEKLEESLKKVISTEEDPIALDEINKLKTAIDALPVGGDTEALTELKEQVEALDTSKADKASVDELNEALKKLNDAIALGATGEELAQAKTELEEAIAKIQQATTSTGDRVESVSLALLPAMSWTPFPDATGVIKDFKILDKEGYRVDNYMDLRRTGTKWEVYSLTNQANLTFEYEVANSSVNTGTEATVLALLPANQWTDLPAPANGTIVDYKIFELDVDILNYLECRRINGVYQVRSLIEKTNLQVEYELN